MFHVVCSGAALFFTRVGADLLSINTANILAFFSSSVYEICLFSFCYYLGMLISVMLESTKQNKVICFASFYFLICSILLQSISLSVNWLLLLRFLQGVFFGAAINDIQTFFWGFPTTAKEEKLMIANGLFSPIVARLLSKFILNPHKVFQNFGFIWVAMLLVISLFLFNLSKIDKVPIEATPHIQNKLQNYHYNKKKLLFFFSISLVAKSFSFFLIFSLRMMGWSANYVFQALLGIAIGELIARVFFVTLDKSKMKSLTRTFLVFFIIVSIIFLFLIGRTNFRSCIFLLSLLGFIQGKLVDLSNSISINTIIEGSFNKERVFHIMRVLSILSLVVAPVIFLPSMIVFSNVFGVFLVRIVLSIFCFYLVA